MSITISHIEPLPGYLLISLTGCWQVEAVLATIDTIVAECRQRGCQRVLVDSMMLEGSLPDWDRYEVGLRVAEVLRRVRIAVLGPPRIINKFSENVAVNRGAQLLVTADRAAALAWLLDQTSARS